MSETTMEEDISSNHYQRPSREFGGLQDRGRLRLLVRMDLYNYRVCAHEQLGLDSRPARQGHTGLLNRMSAVVFAHARSDVFFTT
ncbi:hypothetical protein GDO78_022784 [Eleutherodactylus coqui]|uniref:Uncharacterized protein n=1 Tax=Eleutherodactylus coqui TaxID=57060 RepID=A0A8J6B7U9_ELECQ|nr:hypothetical protein GDO78_022784 [Eleutherodactylus coqui]